jgi:hypothetical protein
MVIEDIEAPDLITAYVTQMVIELVADLIVATAGGWRIYEA